MRTNAAGLRYVRRHPTPGHGRPQPEAPGARESGRWVAFCTCPSILCEIPPASATSRDGPSAHGYQLSGGAATTPCSTH
jgi:hypothetical protein